MKGIDSTKALFLALVQIWASYSAAKQAGRISIWGWLKLVWKNRRILSRFQLIELKAELFDLTGEEMDELRDVTLSALGWQPDDDTRDRFAIAFKAVRDNVLTLILLKNTLNPPRPEIVP